MPNFKNDTYVSRSRSQAHFSPYPMFNLVNRLQGVGNKLMSVALVVCGCIVAITYVQMYAGDVWNLDTAKVTAIKPSAVVRVSRLFGSSDGKPKENQKLTFDLDADLSPLFNWNTKQVFVYLTAEYDGKSDGASNRVTFWDKIVTCKNDALIHVTRAHGKYSVWDVEKSFRDRNATLRLEWNIQPWVGPLIYGSIDTGATFQFADPNKAKKKKEKKLKKEREAAKAAKETARAAKEAERAAKEAAEREAREAAEREAKKAADKAAQKAAEKAAQEVEQKVEPVPEPVEEVPEAEPADVEPEIQSEESAVAEESESVPEAEPVPEAEA